MSGAAYRGRTTSKSCQESLDVDTDRLIPIRPDSLECFLFHRRVTMKARGGCFPFLLFRPETFTLYFLHTILRGWRRLIAPRNNGKTCVPFFHWRYIPLRVSFNPFPSNQITNFFHVQFSGYDLSWIFISRPWLVLPPSFHSMEGNRHRHFPTRWGPYNARVHELSTWEDRRKIANQSWYLKSFSGSYRRKWNERKEVDQEWDRKKERLECILVYVGSCLSASSRTKCNDRRTWSLVPCNTNTIREDDFNRSSFFWNIAR